MHAQKQNISTSSLKNSTDTCSAFARFSNFDSIWIDFNPPSSDQDLSQINYSLKSLIERCLFQLTELWSKQGATEPNWPFWMFRWCSPERAFFLVLYGESPTFPAQKSTQRGCFCFLSGFLDRILFGVDFFCTLFLNFRPARPLYMAINLSWKQFMQCSQCKQYKHLIITVRWSRNWSCLRKPPTHPITQPTQSNILVRVLTFSSNSAKLTMYVVFRMISCICRWSIDLFRCFIHVFRCSLDAPNCSQIFYRHS